MKRGKEVRKVTLYTRKEAAEKLGISVVTLDSERAGGYLAYIQRKPGGKVWIAEEAIEEYLARATHRAAPRVKTRTSFGQNRIQTRR